MKKSYFLWSLLGLLMLQIGWAQQKTITGTVNDETGLPLPGATVIIDGTSQGVATDFDGNFSIQASEGDVLLITYVGYADQRVSVGNQDSYTINMATDNELEEVVVTALGVQREAKSLGYSVKRVSSDDLEQKAEGDIGRVLQGKIAGVNITSSTGISGSSTNIIIRGYTSITGSNQPLFIVDGVPFDSSTNNQDAFFDSINESSRFLDLDPNSIESINVLKGLSATTLYGQQGRNGVILITTKSGSKKISAKGFEASISQSYFQSTPHLPDYQTDYGGGFHQLFGFFFSNGGPNFDTNISDVSQFGAQL